MQENKRDGDRRLSQLIRYLVALGLARGLPCVRSPRWSWAAIPHASSRVRPPTSHISTHTYSTFCLGPMNSRSVCVFVCLAPSATAILAYVHIRLITVGASVAVLSKHASYSSSSSLHTHIPHSKSARAFARRQHSRPDTYRSAHCMIFHAAIRSSLVFPCLTLPSLCARCHYPTQIYTGMPKYQTAYVLP